MGEPIEVQDLLDKYAERRRAARAELGILDGWSTTPVDEELYDEITLRVSAYSNPGFSCLFLISSSGCGRLRQPESAVRVRALVSFASLCATVESCVRSRSSRVSAVYVGGVGLFLRAPPSSFFCRRSKQR